MIKSHCCLVLQTDVSRENPVEGENIFSDTTGYMDVCEVALSQTMVVTADCDVGFDIPNVSFLHSFRILLTRS